MRPFGQWKEFTAVGLVFTFLFLVLRTSSASAGWIPTRPTVDGPQGRLVSLIERDQISQALQSLGIDLDEARRRAAGLSNAEARAALDRLDSLPAGGNAVVGAVLVIFLVLLVTDILGFTDVFPFVR
jgi:hypothetical protein